MFHGNRGLAFENMIEQSISVYETRGQALIKKVATPWQVERDNKGKIYHAYPLQKSTVDFIGIQGTRPVAFEAKSTKIETRFPLDNIKEHQTAFLRDWREHGGQSFFLLHFERLFKTFFVSLEAFEDITRDLDRKSIPVETLISRCPQVENEDGVLINFLPILERVENE